ncbi:MAG: DUF4255 domain-containing protein [Ilumatobacteraceae bacterium]|nr:DUF4255 domain-containing protein [Ilumatobacteraceae bacterium]
MIHDLDSSLRALIERDVLSGGGIEISFESPNKEWVSKLTGPTIDVFLYDIREDLSRRDVFFEEIRDESGTVVERRQPPRRFRLAYLLTAWAKRPEDEHRMLSSLLGCFIRSEMLPEDVLVGSLADCGRPILTQIAIANDEDAAYSQVWSALGGELKPALNLAVTAPFDVSRSVPVGPPVTEEPRITVGRPDSDETEQPRRRRKGAEPPAEAELVAVDTVRGGTEDGPGRVLHVRHLPRRP